MNGPRQATPNEETAAEVVASIFVAGTPDEWLSTVQSLRQHAPHVHLVLGARDLATLGPLEGLGIEMSQQPSPSSLVDYVYLRYGTHVLVLAAPRAESLN